MEKSLYYKPSYDRLGSFAQGAPAPSSRAETFGLHPNAKPTRRRPPRGPAPSIDGHFSALKAVGPAPFESLLERDFQTLLNADPNISHYASQPVPLLYMAPDKKGRWCEHTYTPDFTAEDREGRIIVMEVKAKGLAGLERWQRLKPYIQKAYEEQGVIFQVFTEDVIRAQPRLSNCQRMVMHGRLPVDHAADIVIRRALNSLSKAVRIKNVCDMAQQNQIGARRAFTTIMQLALRGVVKLDLGKPLSLETALVVVR